MAPSSKQTSFIQTLLNDRAPDEHLRVEAQEVLDGRRDRQQAGGIISRLLNAPRTSARPERSEQVAVSEPGVYRKDGEVYIVKPNREKTKLYAKRLVEIGGERVTETDEHVSIEFEYAPGAVYRLSPEDRMPFEDAKALTARYGRCIVCGRHLKAAKSVEAGIGPVCAGYFSPSPGSGAREVARLDEQRRRERREGTGGQTIADLNRPDDWRTLAGADAQEVA